MLLYDTERGGGKVRSARREVRGGKMRGTGARYQCEALGNLRGWNVRGAADNWGTKGVVVGCETLKRN